MTPQALTVDAVRNIAEELMTKYGNTTTLDVKNLLRNRNFFATQQEVSGYMDTLSTTEQWHHTQKNGYRVYSLPPDTNNTLDVYYAKNNEVLDIYVQGKELHIGTGKKYSQIAWQIKTLKRNATAMAEAQQIIKDKKAEGFTQNTQVPAYAVRQQMRTLTHEKPEKVKIGVYDFFLKYHYIIDEQQISENKYCVGGHFSWEKESFENLAQNITHKNWSLNLFLQGNFVANGKKLHDKITRPKQAQDITTNDFVEIVPYSGQLYEVIFTTASGKVVALNKFKEGNYDAFLDKVCNILKNGFAFF